MSVRRAGGVAAPERTVIDRRPVPCRLRAADVGWRRDVEERRRVAIDRLQKLRDEPPEERHIEQVEMVGASGHVRCVTLPSTSSRVAAAPL